MSQPARPTWPVRIAIALSCLALSGLAFMLIDSFKPASDENVLVAILIGACICVPPFVALGVLCGRVRLLLIVGLALFGALVAYLLILLTYFVPI